MAGRVPLIKYYSNDFERVGGHSDEIPYRGKDIKSYQLYENGDICLTTIAGVYAANIGGQLFFIVESAGCYSIMINDTEYPASVNFNGDFPVSFKVFYGGDLEI